jgi:hypothetical protein
MGWWDDVTSAVGDAADAVASAVGAAGDAVEGAFNLISDGLHGIEDGFNWVGGELGAANSWLCEHAGSIGCRVGNILLGGIAGGLRGMGDLVGGLGDLLEHLGGFLGAVLRLDFADAIAQLGLILGDLVLLGLGMLRLITLGSFIGGIVDAWQAEDLRQFVQQLLSDTFGNNPPRLARIIEHVGLHNADWGLPLTATHRVFMLDSAHVPLWQWHENGDIDLYAMAGWLSFDSFSIGRRRTEVRVLNSDGTIYSSIPATRWSISKYLASQGKDVRLQIFALTNRAITDMTEVATKKHARMGIKLSWNVDGLGRFDVPPAHEITTALDLNIDQEDFGRYLVEHGYRLGTYDEQCEALAFTAFFMKAKLGNTVGRSITDGSRVDPCQPNRNDHCCNTVQLTPPHDAGLASASSGLRLHLPRPVSTVRIPLRPRPRARPLRRPVPLWP